MSMTKFGMILLEKPMMADSRKPMFSATILTSKRIKYKEETITLKKRFYQAPLNAYQLA